MRKVFAVLLLLGTLADARSRRGRDRSKYDGMSMEERVAAKMEERRANREERRRGVREEREERAAKREATTRRRRRRQEGLVDSDESGEEDEEYKDSEPAPQAKGVRKGRKGKPSEFIAEDEGMELESFVHWAAKYSKFY